MVVDAVVRNFEIIREASNKLPDEIKDPDHEEYESYVEWLDEEFDPKYFDKNEVNELLRKQIIEL